MDAQQQSRAAAGRPRSSERAARIAAARAEAEGKARRSKVRNLSVIIGLVLVLGIAAIIVLPRLGGSSSPSGSAATPPGLDTYQGATGWYYGKPSAPVTITLYEDFQCPSCEQLETTSGAEFTKLADAGQLRILYSPIAFLDRSSSGNRYSTRAANAWYCAPPAKRKALHDAFYADQPAEGTSGRTDAQLLATAATAGISGAEFQSCLDGGDHEGWVGDHTATVLSTYGQTFGTPFMLVDGKVYAGAQNVTPQVLDQIVAQAAAKG